MRSLQFLLTITTLFVTATFFADDAHGQGLLQRLRSRIVPLVQNQLEQRDAEAADNNLPARPLPNGAAQRDGSTPDAAAAAQPGGANPTARYRTPARPGAGGASRIPAITPPGAPAASPTPAIGAGGAGGVRQAGAESQPGSSDGSNTSNRANSFGRSILSPLDFDDQVGQTPASDLANASIGIKGIEANPGYPGVQITEFASHSRANRDGLRVGDFIFAIDGVPTPTVAALVGQVSGHAPGDRVRLRIGRGGQVSDLDITLVAKPGGNASVRLNPPTNPSAYPPAGPTMRAQDQPQVQAGNQTDGPAETATRPKIGANVRDVPGRRGVMVIEIQPGSPADKAGLKTKDRIVAIDSKMVSDTNSMFDLLALAPAGASADLQLIRDNRLVSTTLSLQSDDKPNVAANASSPSGSVASDPADNRSPTPAASGSLVGGLGSMLGGMFSQQAGGSETSDPKAADMKAAEAEQAVEAELLPPQASKTDDSESVRAEINRLRDQLKQLESRLED